MKSYLILLIVPMNLCIFLVAIGVALAFFRHFRSAFLCASLGILWLFMWSIPMTSLLIGGYLENKYPYRASKLIDNAQAIVVLGGNIADHRKNWFEHFDKKNLHSRIDTADALFMAHKAPCIILSGGNIDGYMSEAEKMAATLKQRGIPTSALITEKESATTRENGLFVKEILQQHNIDSILLVTSALHIPRAMAVMQHLGINAIAAPNPPQITLPDDPHFTVWLPNVRALQGSRSIIKEYIGFAVYWLRGWI